MAETASGRPLDHLVGAAPKQLVYREVVEAAASSLGGGVTGGAGPATPAGGES